MHARGWEIEKITTLFAPGIKQSTVTLEWHGLSPDTEKGDIINNIQGLYEPLPGILHIWVTHPQER